MNQTKREKELDVMFRYFYTDNLKTDVENILKDKALELCQKYYGNVKLGTKRQEKIYNILKDEIKKML